MRTFRQAWLAPPRFRTKEDAMLYLECVKERKEFPEEKWIHPFVVKGMLCVENPEYRDAPFEEILIEA